MVATRTLWRYLQDGTIETVYTGQRCDWTQGGAYEYLGWTVPV